MSIHEQCQCCRKKRRTDGLGSDQTSTAIQRMLTISNSTYLQVNDPVARFCDSFEMTEKAVIVIHTSPTWGTKAVRTV
jgi:phage/plasmid-associated DNA primase